MTIQKVKLTHTVQGSSESPTPTQTAYPRLPFVVAAFAPRSHLQYAHEASFFDLLLTKLQRFVIFVDFFRSSSLRLLIQPWPGVRHDQMIGFRASNTEGAPGLSAEVARCGESRAYRAWRGGTQCHKAGRVRLTPCSAGLRFKTDCGQGANYRTTPAKLSGWVDDLLNPSPYISFRYRLNMQRFERDRIAMLTHPKIADLGPQRAPLGHQHVLQYKNTMNTYPTSRPHRPYLANRVRKLTRGAFLFALLGTFVPVTLSISGCAAAREVNETAADILLPPSSEEQLGQRMAQQIRQEMQVHPNAQVQQYIDQLGQRVVRAARGDVPRGIDFEFTVLQDDQLNAFAIPGGHIYVYSGLLKAVDSEAELMSVLSHEVAHVTERHVAERLTAAYGTELLTQIALGRNPGTLGQIVAGVASQGYLLKYSRTQETEADVTGLNYLIDAGYDPRAMLSFVEELKGSSGGAPTFLLSHPKPQQRIEKLQRIIAQRQGLPQKTNRQQVQQIQQLI